MTEKVQKKRKRGQGEGSIYQRKDGRWTAAVITGYKKGKLQRKTFYGKTRAEVADKLTTELNNQKKGLPPVNDRQTIEQYFKDWLLHTVKPRVSPKTFKTYTDFANLHIIPALGKKVLTKLSPQDVQAFLNDKAIMIIKVKKKEGYDERLISTKTVKHIHACLRCGLNDAMKFGLIHRNVAALVSPPKIVKKDLSILTVEQADKFLESLEGNRLSALYWTAIYLGLRRGELLGLRWQDLDFDSKILRVRGALQEIEGNLVLTETKTETSRRSLPVPDPVLIKMKAHRSKQLEEKLKRGSRWQDNGLVFVTKYGTPISPRNLVRDFHAALEAANIPRMPFHGLRHSCATFLLSKGMPMRFIMQILGHSQISLTANTYSHVTPEMLGDTREIMNSILAKR